MSGEILDTVLNLVVFIYIGVLFRLVLQSV